MFKKLVLSAILLIFSTTGFAQDKYQVLEAVCKVHSAGSLGSGTCIDNYNGTIFVLTNYHVVGSNTNVTCQFYKKGHESIKVPGRVVWTAFKRNDSVDMAIIAINESNFSGYKPSIIKFGDPNKSLSVGQTVLTVGCPEGKWPALVKGHVLQHANGVYYIKPPVENGRSGSSLLDEETGNIIGIITWRTGDNYTGQGMAQDLQTIYAAMSNQMGYRKVDYNHPHWKYNGFLYAKRHGYLPEPKSVPFLTTVQCPGGNCQPFGFGGGGSGNIDPYNGQQGGGGNPYPDGGRLFPTLPGEQQPNPSNPQVPGFPQNPNEPTPAEPQCPDYSEEFGNMEEMYKSLEKSMTDGFVSIEERFNGLDKKNEDFSTRLKNIEDRNPITPGELEDILDSKKYVVPGKLDSFVKKEEFNSTTDHVVSTIEKVSEDIKNTETNITNIQSKLDAPKEVGMDINVITQAVLGFLGFGTVGGLIAWGFNLAGKRLKEGLLSSGLGGPQVPFSVTNQNRQ